MRSKYLLDSAGKALVASVLILLLGVGAFFMSEPVIGQSATEIFEVRQTISGAIAFQASTSPVTMIGTLDGLTGGTSYGTTTARVRTNNVNGYTMTIQFASTAPMIRDGGGGYISSYLSSSSTANYPSGFDTSPANAQIGFSVNASNTADVSTVFQHTGSNCGTSNAGSFIVNNCWRGASTTNAAAATELIATSAPTPASGSTSTVQFRITIPNNPSPAVADGSYTATATLTATEN